MTPHPLGFILPTLTCSIYSKVSRLPVLNPAVNRHGNVLHGTHIKCKHLDHHIKQNAAKTEKGVRLLSPI